jgi:hypothetical protein
VVTVPVPTNAEPKARVNGKSAKADAKA